MKKILIFLILFACIASTTFGLTYGADNYKKHNMALKSLGQNDPLLNFMTEVESKIGGETGTGTIRYVDSGVTTAGAGISWTAAYATLQEGIDASTDNAGDFIYVAQSHEEDLATAAVLLFDCPGLTVIGMGSGDEMPEFSLTAQASTVSVTAPDVTICNLRFLGEWAGGSTLGLDVQATGDGFRMFGCELRSNSSNEELLIALNVTAAANRLVIVGNSFVFETGGNESSAIVFEGASNKTIVAGNLINGDFSDYVILGTGAASVQMLIEGNIIHNLDGTSGKLISFNAATTGDIIGNISYGVGASQAIVANAMFVSPDNVMMTTEDVETRTYEAMLGAFTGASGAGQGASLYADIVLAKADTAAILADTLSISGGALPAAPTSDSLAAFIAGGGVALGTELGNSVSIIDAIGSDGAALLDVAVGLAGIIGIPTDADNAVDSTNIAPNANGSMYERLEFVQAFPGVDSATNFIGIDDAANLGVTTSVTSDADGSVLERLEFIQDQPATDVATNYLGVDDAANLGLTTAVVPDHDGSALERLEAIAMSQFGYDTPNYLAVSTGTFDTTGTWSTVASHEIATVTGLVKMLIIPQCTSSVTSVADGGTIELEDETTDASIIAISTLGAGLMVTNELWVDATLTRTILTQTQLNAITIVVSELDIGYEVKTQALSSGTIVFHIFWTPMSSTGAVVAGAGGTL